MPTFEELDALLKTPQSARQQTPRQLIESLWADMNRTPEPPTPVAPPPPVAPPAPPAPEAPPAPAPEPETMEAIEGVDEPTLLERARTGEFDPVRYAAEREEFTGQNIGALPPEQLTKLVRAYRQRRDEGLTLSGTLKALRDSGYGLGVLKDALLSVGDVAGNIYGMVAGTAGGDSVRGTQSAIEIAAAMEAAGKDTTDLARSLVRKVKDMALPVTARSDEDLRDEFLFDVANRRQREKIAKGRGEVTTGILSTFGTTLDQLQKEGVNLDPQEIERMTIPLDPTNYVPVAGGFALLNKAGKTLMVAKTAEKLAEATSRVNQVLAKGAGVAAQAVPKAVELTGKAAETVSKVVPAGGLRGGAAGLIADVVTGGGVSPISAAVGAVAKPTLQTAGQILQAAGKRTGEAVGNLAERAARFTLDNAVTPAAKGAVVGGVFSVPLALAADSDEAAASIIGGGMSLGALAGGLQGVKEVAAAGTRKLGEIYQTVKRAPVESKPYGTDVTLDLAHSAAQAELAKTRPGDANLVNVMRETFRDLEMPNGRRANVEIYTLDPDTFEAHTGKTASGYFIEEAGAGVAGPYTAKIFLRQSPTGIFHEPGHALQAVMRRFLQTPEQWQAWMDTLQSTYKPEGLQRFQNYYETLIGKKLNSQQVLEELGAEVISNALRGHPLMGVPLPVKQRAVGLIGSAMEKMGLYNPRVVQNFLTPGIEEVSPAAARPGGASLMGAEHSFLITRQVNSLLKELRKAAPKEAPPTLPPEMFRPEEAPPPVATAPIRPPPAATAPVQPPVATTPPVTRPPAEVTPPPAEVTPPPAPEAPPLEEGAEAARRDQAQAKVADPNTVLILDTGDPYFKWDEGEQALRAEGASEEMITNYRALRPFAERGQPVKMDYLSVTREGGPAPYARRIRRPEQEAAYIAEALGALPEEVRSLYEKVFIPGRIIIRRTAKGELNLNVVGTSPEKLFGNAVLALREIAKKGQLSRIPIETTSGGKLTAEGAQTLWEALVDYTNNHSHGYAGDGSAIKVPPGYDSYIPQQDPDYTPRKLIPAMSDFVNLLVGIEPPKTTKRGSARRFTKEGREITTPANVEAQALAEAQAGREPGAARAPRPSAFADPQKNFYKEFGRNIQEVNPLRDELGINFRDLLAEGVEELSIEHIGPVSPVEPTVGGLGAAEIRPISVPLATAGLLPTPGRLAPERGLERAEVRPPTAGPSLQPVRLYRGETGGGGASSVWWTANPEKAAQFAAGGTVYRVDVPKNVAETGRQAARAQGQGGDTFVLPVEWTKKAEVHAERAVPPVYELELPAPAEVIDASPDQWRQMSTEFQGRYGGGLTGLAFEMGSRIMDPDQLKALQDAYTDLQAQAKEAMKALDLDQAFSLGAKVQFFREAIEAATGEGRSAEFIRDNYDPTYVAPLQAEVTKTGQSLLQGEGRAMAVEPPESREINATAGPVTAQPDKPLPTTGKAVGADPKTQEAIRRSTGVPVQDDGGANAFVTALALPDVDAWFTKYFDKNPLVEKTYSPQDIEDFKRGLRATKAIFGDMTVFPEIAGGSTIRQNSDKLFKKTWDLSTVCPNQDQYVMLIQQLERERGQVFSPQQRFLIGQMMADGGVTTCFYCYGTGGRNTFDWVISKATDVFNTLAKETNPKASAADKVFKEKGGIGWRVLNAKGQPGALWDTIKRYGELARNEGLVIDPVRARDIARGLIKPASDLEAKIVEGLRGFTQAAAKSNTPKGYAPSTNEVLKMRDAEIAEYNASAGLRMNSQTDFRVWHVLDISQFLAQCQMKKAMAHVYTRKPAFLDVFGGTGLKFNMSVDVTSPVNLPRELRVGDMTEARWKEVYEQYGEPNWNDMNSMPEQKAMDYRERFPRDAGTMLVALDEYQLWWGLNSPKIDMIIPYHRGAVPKAVDEHVGAKDFSEEQHEEWPADWKRGETRTAKLPGGRTVSLTMPENPGERPVITREQHRNNKRDYLAMAKQMGFLPRFARFMSHPNYMKLVRDVARNPGNQVVVDATKINWDEASKLVTQWIESGEYTTERQVNEPLLRYVRDRIEKGEWPESPIPKPSLQTETIKPVK